MIYLHILLKGYEIHFCEWYVESILLVYGHALHVCIFIYTSHEHVNKMNIFLCVHLANTWSFKAHLQHHYPPHGINLSLVKAPTAPFIAPEILCPDFRKLYLSLHSQHLAKYLIYSKWSINAAFTAFWSATLKTRVLSCVSSTENCITCLHTIARQLSRTWGTVGAVKQEGATANLRSKSQI